MPNNEIQELKEKISGAVIDFQDSISEIQDIMLSYNDLLNETLCVALNTLITAGFVPNAKLKFDGKTYKFLGYTEGLGMKFEDSEGNVINGGSAETTLKNLSRWAKE